MFISFGMNKANAWGGGGVVPLCKPNRYRPPQSVGFWGPPLVWNGYILCLFWSEIRYGFQGNYGSVLEHIYHFSSKWLRKKEKQENFKWIWKTLCHFPQCIHSRILWLMKIFSHREGSTRINNPSPSCSLGIILDTFKNICMFTVPQCISLLCGVTVWCQFQSLFSTTVNYIQDWGCFR